MPLTKDVRHQSGACPACSRQLDCSNTLGEPDEVVIPKAGDVTVCLGCQAILEYTGDSQVYRFASREVLDSLPLETRKQLTKMQVAAALAVITAPRRKT